MRHWSCHLFTLIISCIISTQLLQTAYHSPTYTSNSLPLLPILIFMQQNLCLVSLLCACISAAQHSWRKTYPCGCSHLKSMTQKPGLPSDNPAIWSPLPLPLLDSLIHTRLSSNFQRLHLLHPHSWLLDFAFHVSWKKKKVAIRRELPQSPRIDPPGAPAPFHTCFPSCHRWAVCDPEAKLLFPLCTAELLPYSGHIAAILPSFSHHHIFSPQDPLQKHTNML